MADRARARCDLKARGSMAFRDSLRFATPAELSRADLLAGVLSCVSVVEGSSSAHLARASVLEIVRGKDSRRKPFKN